MGALRQLLLPVVNDCSHIMMNLVKTILKEDTRLAELCANIGKLWQQLILTDKSFCSPQVCMIKITFPTLTAPK